MSASAELGLTPARVMTSEWIKFRTLRSSWYVLLAAVVSLVGIGLIVAFVVNTTDVADLDPELTAASAPLRGYLLAELLLGVLGVLFVTGEYGTGMIRSTFAAVPRRLPVLGAKSVVFGLVALVTMTVSSFVTFFAAQAVLSGEGREASLSDPGALRAVVGVGVLLALIGLLGGALGWILRSTAGAISTLVGLLLLLPVLFQLLPGSVSTSVGKYLPSEAGGAFVTSTQTPDTLAPWAGLGVLAMWVVAALVAAVVLVRRRDA